MLHVPIDTRRLAAALVIPLVLAACNAGARYGAGGTTAPGVALGSSGGAPTIAIASPGDGAQVSVPFALSLESNVPLGAPETGDHHAHLYFDSGTDAADYDIVDGNTWQVTRSLSPGEHKITVALANPDHSLAGPTQTVTVTVTAGSGAGSSPAPASPSPSDPGYTY